MPKPIVSLSRAEFHLEFSEKALKEAQRLWAERDNLGTRWLVWVASELYQLKPAPYANMVRRELEKMNQ